MTMHPHRAMSGLYYYYYYYYDDYYCPVGRLIEMLRVEFPKCKVRQRANEGDRKLEQHNGKLLEGTGRIASALLFCRHQGMEMCL